MYFYSIWCAAFQLARESAVKNAASCNGTLDESINFKFLILRNPAKSKSMHGVCAENALRIKRASAEIM